MKKITLIAAAIAALGVSAQANAFVATPIVFDMNGAAAGGVINVTSFDWTPGNALAKDAIGSTSGTFTTYFQASLGAFIYDDGGSQTSSTPFAGSEFTVQAQIFEQGTGLGGGTATFLSLGGTYEIFYDTNAATKANNLTGQGYGDGTRILAGTINAGGSGAFTNSTILNDILVSLGFLPANPTPTTDLDGFVDNDRPGIYSHVGNGSSTLTVDVTSTDSNFFKSDITSLIVDLNDTTNLASPFNQTNPSEEVFGQTPVYGVALVDGFLQEVNGAGCEDGVATCDFHFQSDSSTSFQATVPEPGSLAIAGAGLALMSLIRRRKSK